MSRNKILWSVLSVLTLLALACSLWPGGTSTPTPTGTPHPTSTPRPTNTPLPPKPVVPYTPVPAGMLAPVVVQRSPERGEALTPDGASPFPFGPTMR